MNVMLLFQNADKVLSTISQMSGQSKAKKSSVSAHLQASPSSGTTPTSALVADAWHSQADINDRIFECVNSQQLLLNHVSVTLKDLSSRVDNLDTQFCSFMQSTSVLLVEIPSLVSQQTKLKEHINVAQNYATTIEHRLEGFGGHGMEQAKTFSEQLLSVQSQLDQLHKVSGEGAVLEPLRQNVSELELLWQNQSKPELSRQNLDEPSELIRQNLHEPELRGENPDEPGSLWPRQSGLFLHGDGQSLPHAAFSVPGASSNLLNNFDPLRLDKAASNPFQAFLLPPNSFGTFKSTSISGLTERSNETEQSRLSPSGCADGKTPTESPALSTLGQTKESSEHWIGEKETPVLAPVPVSQTDPVMQSERTNSESQRWEAS